MVITNATACGYVLPGTGEQRQTFDQRCNTSQQNTTPGGLSVVGNDADAPWLWQRSHSKNIDFLSNRDRDRSRGLQWTSWECPRCSLLNPGDYMRCVACRHSQRRSGAQQDAEGRHSLRRSDAVVAVAVAEGMQEDAQGYAQDDAHVVFVYPDAEEEEEEEEDDEIPEAVIAEATVVLRMKMKIAFCSSQQLRYLKQQQELLQVIAAQTQQQREPQQVVIVESNATIKIMVSIKHPQLLPVYSTPTC